MKYCPECGSNVEGMKFCSECGVAIKDTKQAEDIKEAEQPSKTDITPMTPPIAIPSEKKFYEYPLSIVLFSAFIPPVGAVFFWLNKKMGVFLKIFMTIVLLCYTMILWNGLSGLSESSKISHTASSNQSTTSTTSSNTASSKEQTVTVNGETKTIPSGSSSGVQTDVEFKNSCTPIPYDELARYPDKYKGQKVVIIGKIIQVITKSSGGQYRIAIDGNYDQIIYVDYTGSFTQGNILENDNITFWGTFDGQMSYESTLGGKITVPSLKAKLYQINK